MNTDLNDSAPAEADVVIEPLPQVPKTRRAADALRLFAAVLTLAVGLVAAAFAHSRIRTTERALIEVVVTMPMAWRQALTAGVQLVLVLMPLGMLVASLIRRRFAAAARLLIGAVIGTTLGVLLSHVLLGRSHPPSWPGLLSEQGWVFVATFPPVAWLSGATAIVTASEADLSGRWRRGLWWVTGASAIVEMIVGGFLPVDAVVAATAGVAVGSSILLISGEPPRRPSAEQVVAALQECGVEVAALKELPPSPAGPAAFNATTHAGTALTIRVFASDDRDHDRLARLSRWVLVRHPQDDRAGITVESAAEHEMLAMVAAARAGARVPEPAVAYPVARGRGPGGALVAWIDVGGRRLDLMSPDEVADETLGDLWTSIRLLRQHRLAHRQLRTDNIIVDDAGKAWVIGLVVAELGATERQLDTDVAELLAALAVQMGAARAVASSVSALGGQAVAGAAAYLQPLALSGPTRARVRSWDRERSVSLSSGWARRGLRPGGRPSLLGDLRSEVGRATGQSPPRLEPLARFTWKKALALLGAFAVIYLVLPQLANARAAVRALGHADWWWVIAAVPALFVAQAFSTLMQVGAIPAPLPFIPTYVVQFGGSFLNRVTPNNVGGMAFNFRYLQKAGVDSGAATGSVGLQAIAGVAANLVLITVFFAQTGRRTAVHFGLHSRQWLFLVLAALVIGSAVLAFTPLGRRFFQEKIWGFLRSAGSTIGEVAKSPGHVALVVAGALGGPTVQIVALGLCIHAVGGKLPFVQVGAVYLGARLLASAAPVPGGLGALEAAMVAGLSALGMPIGAAASAVLIYRLITFWLTIPIGWISLKVAEGRGYV
jgi:uncharacterized protein (TIRG00374 family)